MRLFNATYYHGSGKRFDKFDFAFMNTGQRAQAHGWGIYLAEQRNVAEGYRQEVSGNNYAVTLTLKFDEGIVHYCTQNDDGHVMSGIPGACNEASMDNPMTVIAEYMLMWDYEHVDEHAPLNVIIDDFKDDVFPDVEKHLEWQGYDKDVVYEAYQMMNDIRSYSVDEHSDESMLATVHVDDDIVLVRESDRIDSDHPLYNAIKLTWDELAPKYTFSDNNAANIIFKVQDIFLNELNEYPSSYDTGNFLRHICMLDDVTSYVMMPYLKGLDVWDNVKTSEEHMEKICDDIIAFLDEANEHDTVIETGITFKMVYAIMGNNSNTSMTLLRNGIDGISYDGQIDGECIVLFNLDKCKIIEKE